MDAMPHTSHSIDFHPLTIGVLASESVECSRRFKVHAPEEFTELWFGQQGKEGDCPNEDTHVPGTRSTSCFTGVQSISTSFISEQS